MYFNITDEIMSQFLSGVFTIFALVGVGGVLSVLFKAMNKKFSFTRMALVLALTPLCLVNFIDRGSMTTLYLFSMLIVLFGITVDGINFLLLPKERLKAEPKVAEKETQEAEPDPGVIVWEKAN